MRTTTGWRRALTCGLIPGLAIVAAGCAGTAYRADRDHARVVAPIAFAEGHTGKPPASGVSPAAASTTAPIDATALAASASAGPAPGATSETETARDANEQQPAQRRRVAHQLPDPPPLTGRDHYVLEFEYSGGEIRLAAAQPHTTDKPLSTQRAMGRFAFELWIGRELIDRVRFDFPLLGAEPPRGDIVPLHAPPSFAVGAEVRRKIVVPASARATLAQLVDRATGDIVLLPWPPEPHPPSVQAKRQ